MLWSKSGDQGEGWHQAEIDIYLTPPNVLLFFEAETVEWKFGDIALDNVEYTKGLCKGYLF
jgi:hypothetical protein